MSHVSHVCARMQYISSNDTADIQTTSKCRYPLFTRPPTRQHDIHTYKHTNKHTVLFLALNGMAAQSISELSLHSTVILWEGRRLSFRGNKPLPARIGDSGSCLPPLHGRLLRRASITRRRKYPYVLLTELVNNSKKR